MACETHFNVTVQSEYFAKVFRYAKVLAIACQQAPDEDKKVFGEQSEWSRAKLKDSESEVIGTARDARLPGADLQVRSRHEFKILKGTLSCKS